jgi:hypothetical protein
MNIERMAKVMRWALPDYVELNVVEDADACKELSAEWYIEGFFDPFFEEVDPWETFPIEINIVCGSRVQLLEDNDLFTDELLTTYAHELIHFEQYREGRFDFKDLANNEEEAYARESDWKKPWHRTMEEKVW